MPGSSNFEQWNPNAINQESDVLYTADSLRTGGAPLNAIFPSNLANKLFYQVTTFVAALAQMMANKGYSPNDGSASPGSAMVNLETVLANLMTQADMSIFALLASPIFTGNPQAPTPPLNDNDLSIATTAFVQAAIQSIFQANFSPNNGFFRLVLFGNFMLQWNTGVAVKDPSSQHITFGFPFPTACLTAIVSNNSTGGDVDEISVWSVTSFNATGANVYFSRNADHGGNFNTPVVWSIGH